MDADGMPTLIHTGSAHVQDFKKESSQKMKRATYMKTTMNKNKNEEVMSRVWRSLYHHQDLEKRMVIFPTEEEGKKEFEYLRVRPNKRSPSNELKDFVLKRFGINPFKQ